MRRALTVAAVWIAALVVAAPAPAAGPALVTSHYGLAGWEALGVAGGATVLAAEGERTNTVLSLVPGSPPHILAKPHTSGEGGGTTSIAVSSARLAVFQQGYEPGYKGSPGSWSQAVFASALGAQLQEQKLGCSAAPGLDEGVRGEPGIQEHSAIAVSGDVLVYDSFGCVVVRDLASGFERTIRLQATIEPVFREYIDTEPSVLAVAGRLVAYRANPQGGEGAAAIAVYDIDAGHELYRVPVGAADGVNGASFALQADGTLVVARSKACTATVTTPGVPTAPLGVPACFVEGVAEGRALVVAPAAGGHRELAWTSLSEPALHEMADLGPGGALLAAEPRLSGSTAVYALRDCTAPHVYRAALSAAGLASAPPPSCPLHVAAHATLTRRGLAVTVRCALGCEATVSALHTGRRSELVEAGAGTTIEGFEEPYLKVAPRGAHTLRMVPEEEEPRPAIRTLRRLAARLRGHQRVLLRIDFRVATPASGPSSLYAGEGGSEPGAPRPSLVHAIVPLALASGRKH